MRSRIVGGRETARVTDSKRRLQSMESIDPITMPIGVFASEPTHEIAIDKVEAKQCAAEKTGPRTVDGGWLGGRGARSAKESDGCDSGVESLIGVAQNGGVQVLKLVPFLRQEKWPDRMEDVQKSGDVCSS
jgi:hypothetical protein